MQMQASLLAPACDGAVAVTTRSIRDPAQGIYEYLEERHEQQGVRVGCFLLPLRLSGWISRREGRLTTKFKRRFCVFDAPTNQLSVFADDDTSAGKLLRQLVVSRIKMTTGNHTNTSTVHIVGYERSQELGKDASDRMSRRRTWSGGSMQLPAEQQRFFKPQAEVLATVSAKQAVVWSHCFRHHMKNYRRRQRIAKLSQIQATGQWDTLDDDELEALVGHDHDAEDDSPTALEPEFTFIEHRVDDADADRRAGGGGVRGRQQDPPLVFDDESDVRISSSARFTSLNAKADAFPSRPGAHRHHHLNNNNNYEEEEDARAPSSRAPSSMGSSDPFVVVAMGPGSGSIWDDDELLAHRVDHDAVKPTRLLATGAFGDVWLAHFHAQTLAVKRLKPQASSSSSSSSLSSSSSTTRDRIRQFMHEIRVLSRLDHERIVAFVGVAWTMESDLQLLMEYMPYGDLRSYLNYVTIQRDEKEKRQQPRGPASTVRSEPVPAQWTAYLWRLAVDIAEGLVYLHSLHPPLVHCDLKSRNLLLHSDLRAKIADFGLARWMVEDDSVASEPDSEALVTDKIQRTALGTGRWIAPEILAGNGEYAPAVDVYSFGVVLTEIDTSQVPFYDKAVSVDGDVMSEDVLLHHIMADAWTPSFSTHCPPDVCAIAEQCMAFHPEHRPTSLDVAHRLRKAFAQAKRQDSVR